jgi:methionyl-tRNA formyltransferase
LHRVVVLCSANHLGSLLVLNGLLRSRKAEVVGIVSSSSVSISRKGWRIVRKTGWRFPALGLLQKIAQSAALLWSRLAGSGGLRSRKRVAREEKIPLLSVKDINTEDAVRALRALEPDVIVSAFYNRYLRQEALSVPRIACLNMHPGPLPEYRGTMVYFWVLQNGERESAATIHVMDAGIDTGPVLRRRSFPLEDGWTQLQVLEKASLTGVELLEEIFGTLTRESVARMEREEGGEDARHYSVPRTEDVRAYLSKRPYFRVRDVFRTICRPRHPLRDCVI